MTGEAILERWARETGSSKATVKKYATTLRQLTRVLGFDDLSRVTKADVARFKEAGLALGRANDTVQDDVIALGTICKWAVRNGKLAENPFADMAPRVTKRGPAARLPFDDETARVILLAARKETGWKRWLPWMMAFTGARISEVAELPRRDVRQ